MQVALIEIIIIITLFSIFPKCYTSAHYLVYLDIFGELFTLYVLYTCHN